MSVNVKFTELNVAGIVTGAEIFCAVQSGDSVQITRDQALENLTDPTTAQQPSTKAYVDAAIAAINPGTGSQVITGCGVAWSGTGLVFQVSPGTYSINGTSYTITTVPFTSITLDAADNTNPRIDLIIATSSGTFDKITGTPAATPQAPTVDPATQLMLTFVYVAANATVPGNITQTLLYDENVGSATEWDTSSSGATWSLGSTNNPYHLTKDIEATSVGTGAYAQLQKGSGTIDPSTQNSLVFFIRSKATWAANRSLTLSLLNNGVQFGNGISFRDGVFGFNSSNTTSYQQIVVPIANFQVAGNPINQVRFAVAGTGSSIGFYLDLITLEAGVNANVQNFLVDRGTWTSTSAYVRNDFVTYNGVSYICLVANGNSAPSPTNTNWRTVSSIPRTIGASVDGGSSNVNAGFLGYFTTPYIGRITGWSIAAKGTSPNLTFDIWKIGTGTSVPTNSNTITGGGANRPSLTTNNAIRSSTITNWTNSFNAGDIFGFNLDSAANATWAHIFLETIQQ